MNDRKHSDNLFRISNEPKPNNLTDSDTNSIIIPIRKFSILILQLAASIFWLVSIIIYNRWEYGDIFHIIAAGLWTLSNLLAFPDAFQETILH